MNLRQFEVISFDCYGTLIDWETGILSALQPFLRQNKIHLAEDQVLELYARLESTIQEGAFQNYKSILQKVMKGFGQELGFSVQGDELNLLVNSLKTWPPFADTIPALQRLKQNCKLAIISNIDNDLFSASNRLLQVDFDWIITAEQVQSYKPSLNNFNCALKTIGRPKEKILHVAQSIYHDIIPAKKIGLNTVWANRRHNKKGFGATREAFAKPDLEVPDLKSLVETFDLKRFQ